MNILIYAKKIKDKRQKAFCQKLTYRKISSIFIFKIINESTSPLTFRMRTSNFILIELTFKYATASLLK